mmetsp:Transcript_7613/g.16770  ORF Transcript_7613/g.16770 Transcript_7613/m.16770 type:complete len:96 (+) Transcript_7613:81-368(+)
MQSVSAWPSSLYARCCGMGRNHLVSIQSSWPVVSTALGGSGNLEFGKEETPRLAKGNICCEATTTHMSDVVHWAPEAPRRRERRDYGTLVWTILF